MSQSSTAPSTQCPTCGTFIHSVSLAANEARECNQKFDTGPNAGDSLDEGWVGSVMIEASGSGLIVGIVNERGDATTSDTGLVYNAVNY